MEQIHLDNVLPEVFAQRDNLSSEVWKQQLTFNKGHLYLVEADSGKKSGGANLSCSGAPTIKSRVRYCRSNWAETVKPKYDCW